jgi:hypothetical protein
MYDLNVPVPGAEDTLPRLQVGRYYAYMAYRQAPTWRIGAGGARRKRPTGGQAKELQLTG